MKPTGPAVRLATIRPDQRGMSFAAWLRKLPLATFASREEIAAHSAKPAVQSAKRGEGRL